MFYLCYYNKLSVSKRVKHGLILLLLMPNLIILAILVLPGPQDINKQVGPQNVCASVLNIPYRMTV